MSEIRDDGGGGQDLTLAFPASVSEAAHRAVAILPPAGLKSIGTLRLHVDNEGVEIPYRIYDSQIGDGLAAGLAPVGRAALDCLYTRHHDGLVRQAHLESVIGSPLPWVVRYVVALIGEYVVEILASILERLDLDSLDSPERQRYGRFVAANPAFFEKTARRVTSYWNCYYRSEYPVMDASDGRFPGYPRFRPDGEASSGSARDRTSDPTPRKRRGRPHSVRRDSARVANLIAIATELSTRTG